MLFSRRKQDKVPPTQKSGTAAPAEEEKGSLHYLVANLQGRGSRLHQEDGFAFGNALETPIYNIPGGVTEHVQEQFLNAFVSFAKTGDPNHAALPEWRPCTKDELVTMIFDKEADARVNFDDELLELYARIAPKFEMNFPGMENDQKRWLY